MIHPMSNTRVWFGKNLMKVSKADNNRTFNYKHANNSTRLRTIPGIWYPETDTKCIDWRNFVYSYLSIMESKFQKYVKHSLNQKMIFHMKSGPTSTRHMCQWVSHFDGKFLAKRSWNNGSHRNWLFKQDRFPIFHFNGTQVDHQAKWGSPDAVGPQTNMV